MKTLSCIAEAILFGLLFPVFCNSVLFAETANCTAITSVPFTITTEGVYCLTNHLTSAVPSVAAITVDADDVVIDLNGFTLGGLGGPLSTAIGISVFGHTDITIKNGTVRGFYIGIFVGNTRTAVIEGISVQQSRLTGIEVAGRNTSSVIRNNQIVSTGGTAGTEPNPFGIRIRGTGNQRVINNDVMDTDSSSLSPSGVATGISLEGCCSVVENNRISNTLPPSGVRSVGINMESTINCLAVGNRITFMTVGIRVFGGGTKIRDNMAIGVQFPFQGGIDAGNNN